MIKKITERSSAFVVISRKTLLLGMAGIAVVSFALGYFLAYGGPSSDKLVKHVEADNKIAASEEKTVLDSSGKPTVVMPPATPDAIPKEPVQRTPELPQADQGKAAPRTGDPQKKTEAAPNLPVPAVETKKESPALDKKTPAQSSRTAAQAGPGTARKMPDRQDNNKAGAVTEKRTDKKADKHSGNKPEKQGAVAAEENKKDAVQPKIEMEGDSSPTPSIKHSKKSGHVAAKKKHSGKSYALQVGSFTDARKARRLKKKLDSKGYKTYITTYSPKKGKTFSRVRIGPYATKEEASEVIPELKDQGLEGVIVPGRR